jgi:glutamine kinase
MPKGNSKASTLKWMEEHIQSAEVLPQFTFRVSEWQKSERTVLSKLRDGGWWSMPLIVRSSAGNEDTAFASLAGKYVSVADVQGEQAVRGAIGQVIQSYGTASETDEVLIQPLLRGVRMSGVAFSREPSSDAPYIVINYDDSTGSTDSVTSGRTNEIRTHYVYTGALTQVTGPLGRVIALIREVQSQLAIDAVDIEFAFTAGDRLFLLQARPLVCVPQSRGLESRLDSTLSDIHSKIQTFNQVHPYLHGRRTVLGVMPDWNPAEIVGIRPKSLALSLYCDIVTDTIWAYQRDNYGYKNLRSFPLLLKLAGLPYIDVRVSFNSFIPSDVDAELSEKLANYYLDRLVASPSYHDKVEFEVVFSCYTFDLPKRLEKLQSHGFTVTEMNALKDKLRSLTNRIIHGETGLWKQDINKIGKLTERHRAISESSLDTVSKIYWLLEDCKRYGTLPFAGLARAGFIAVQMLRSLESTGILTRSELDRFMADLNTVSSQMGIDRSRLSKSDFLKKYGHLRPGTYDILSPRYDEDPDRYFNWDVASTSVDTEFHEKSTPFALSLEQMRKINALLKQHELEYDVLGLFDFLKAAIEGREYSKFVFTKSLSDALSLIKKLGAEHGFSNESIAHMDISVLKTLYGSSASAHRVIEASIREGMESHSLTSKIQLPALIVHPDDIYSFEQLRHQPNFITLKSAMGKVVDVQQAGREQSQLHKSILFIPSADPGYDWIFSHGIAGFVTMYGGANSHMAIRAAELGVPAVIGSGESLYKAWAAAKRVELDCANKQVRVVG